MIGLLKQLACMMASGFVPCRAARVGRVSPGCTMYSHHRTGGKQGGVGVNVGDQVGTDVARGVQVAVGGFIVGLDVRVKEGREIGVDVGKNTGVLVGKGTEVTGSNGVRVGVGLTTTTGRSSGASW